MLRNTSGSAKSFQLHTLLDIYLSIYLSVWHSSRLISSYAQRPKNMAEFHLHDPVYRLAELARRMGIAINPGDIKLKGKSK